MKDFIKIITSVIFWILFIGIFLLSGCAKKAPTETIIDNHIEHIGQVIDYATNNFDQNVEVVALENELKNCQIVLSDVKQSYKTEIGKCESEKDYWRLFTIGLIIAIVGAIFLRIKRII